MTVDFPLNDLLNPQRCYDMLVSLLHPGGLHCPNGHGLDQCGIHKRSREPLYQYLCKARGRSFNAFTGTVLQGTHYTPVQLVQLLRGIVKGEPTMGLAREMGVDRKWLLKRRHQLQDLAASALLGMPLPDVTAEVDAMSQNAGEKGDPHRDPRIPREGGETAL